MPHICLNHTPGLKSLTNTLVQNLSQGLENSGINKASIKCYAISMGDAYIAGQPGGDMLHINLRVMKRPGRRQDVVTQWLLSLRDIAAEI